MKPRRTPPGELARLWAAMPVRLSSVEVRRRAVPLADYPGGPRPSSVVCLSGDGCRGFGENVAFTDEEQDRFMARVPHFLAVVSENGDKAGHKDDDKSAASVEWWTMRLASAGPSPRAPYERAALEAALIDLAMRQGGWSLGELAGAAEGGVPVRYVASFAASPDPCGQIRRLRRGGYVGDLKLDVDPGWDQRTCEALAAERGVAILDFKGRGTAETVRRLAALFPETIFEDPPPGATPPRVSRDIAVGDADVALIAASRGEAVNLKAPRMGGPLELLKGLQLVLQAAETAHARRPSVPAYFGGMFEVGVGRIQARQLAALYCSDAPNDLALNIEAGADAHAAGGGAASPPVIVRLDGIGFGAL